MGEMPDEQGVELLENRPQPHASTVRADAFDERHQLAVLFLELAANIFERRAHGDRSDVWWFESNILMSERALLVEDVMTTDVVTLHRNDKLSIAEEVMKHKRIRHIPVLDGDGSLCGIVTQRDLFRGIILRSLGYGSRAEEKMLDMLSIKDAMHEDVVTITPDALLADAAGLMLEKKIGCLPVVDGGRLVGLLSEADFVRQFAEHER